MAGMGDNPLVGDYTKGISKGHSYFVALNARCMAEKFDPKRIVSDLEMGLIRDQKARVQRSISQSGLGGFGPKTAFSSVAIQKQIVRKMPKKKAPEVVLSERFLLLKKHFGK